MASVWSIYNLFICRSRAQAALPSFPTRRSSDLSLVELKMQMEDLHRRIEERPSQRVEVIEVGNQAPDTRHQLGHIDPLDSTPEPEQPVIYKAGMSMTDVERAAIDAALRETHGNRRKAAENLGI